MTDMNSFLRRRPSRGFTLIEIMVVVVILGILAALVAPNVMRRIDDAQITKVKQDLRAFETALNLYKMDNYKYPTTEQGLKALITQPNDPTCATGSRAAISATPASSRIRGRTTTFMSTPASMASTTSTPSARTARKAAKA